MKDNRKSFLKEVKQEYKNVNWPNKEQVVASTGVVLVFVFIMSFFLFASDLGIMKIVETVFRLIKGE
ncbi:MAG TPA: preprotein translocase subunit SecE [Spirochaetia bacterium]|nr:MAG: preprotein translocase subunit SecE [Spirochaetes bacterium GWB1_36_13]HCL58194.1 preprotein translocase subunit SecE [Spirochaetia bacterium]